MLSFLCPSSHNSLRPDENPHDCPSLQNIVPPRRQLIFHAGKSVEEGSEDWVGEGRGANEVGQLRNDV